MPGNDTLPLAPTDLLRAYANIASRVNQDLPKIHARLDEVHGIALGAHGIASELRIRIEDIAIAVKARPRVVSLPPPADEKFEINVSPTKTGTHLQIESQEIQRLQTQWAEKAAREQGARDYALELERKEEIRRKEAESKRSRNLYILAFVAAIASIATYAIDHVSIQSSKSSKIEVRP